MVIKQILLLCIFSVPALVFAEDSVDLPLQWKAGEKQHYEIIKTRQKTKETGVTFKSVTRTDLEIEVISVNQDGYLIAWTHGDTRFDDPRQGANPVVQQMGKLLKDFKIILELDSQVLVKGVKNWQELKEKSSTILDTLTKMLEKAGMDTATIEKAKAPVVSMLSTRQGIETMCTREAQLFFMLLGGSYSTSEPIEYEDKLPNLLGGEPFPSRVTLTLKEVDRESGRAIITWTQTLDPEKAKRIMEKTFRDMSARLGSKAPQGEMLKSFTVEDKAEFSVDLSSGWLDRVTHKRSTKIGKATQEDILTIVRKLKKDQLQNKQSPNDK